MNSIVSKQSVRKFSNHFWYLSPEAAAKAIFDESVSDEVKMKMVWNLRTEIFSDEESLLETENSIFKWFRISNELLPTLIQRDIDYFDKPESIEFFKRFKTDISFLDIDVTQWMLNENYIPGLQIVGWLKVMNDVAERGIKLITDYNDRITYIEEQKQFVIQVIEYYNQNYPNANKITLTKKM